MLPLQNAAEKVETKVASWSSSLSKIARDEKSEMPREKEENEGNEMDVATHFADDQLQLLIHGQIVFVPFQTLLLPTVRFMV